MITVMVMGKVKHLLVFIFVITIIFLKTIDSMGDSGSDSHHHVDMEGMMGPNSLWQSPRDCGEMAVWDVSMVMCMPISLKDMPMSMLMIHGNGFLSRVWQKGLRGRVDSFSTNMLMVDIGSSVGDSHYINLDLMLTSELWSVPSRGYPLLLQVGEYDRFGDPYIDAQHPHSSPIMGLTLSDTIRLNDHKDFLKIFIAPRGESTDGPIAFMHRLTGVVNPNAPLGHHVGQDVGHITSSLIGGTLKLGQNRFEASIFNGSEPMPSRVDLPIKKPDSFSFRYIRETDDQGFAMISFANVDASHPGEVDRHMQQRYSFSHYLQRSLGDRWGLYHSFIFGGVSGDHQVPFLSSFADEFLFKDETNRIWGRVEALQRTSGQLKSFGSEQSTERSWVYAFSLGYTRRLWFWQGAELNAGAMLTQNILPTELRASYGGHPYAFQVLIQLGGMHMWSLRE